eukprot:jgi/Chlat1/2606/Chrsp178S02455
MHRQVRALVSVSLLQRVWKVLTGRALRARRRGRPVHATPADMAPGHEAPVIQEREVPASWQAEAARNWVPDEVEDCDGDAACGFIDADIPPRKHPRGTQMTNIPFTLPSCISTCALVDFACLFAVAEEAGRMAQGGVVDLLQEDDACVDDDGFIWEEEEASFTCAVCKCEAVPLKDVYTLPDCACLICTPCIKRYATRMLQDAIARAAAPAGSSTFVDLTGNESRICKSSAATRTANLGLIKCPSPKCRANIPEAELQRLLPRTYAKWCDAATEALLSRAANFSSNAGMDSDSDSETDVPVGLYVRCPNTACRVPIEMCAGEAPAPPPVPSTSSCGVHERAAAAAMHRAKHRYSCRACRLDFCGQCIASPYHEGLMCAEHKFRQTAPKCRYCGNPVMGPGRGLEEENKVANMRVRALKKWLKDERVEYKWCVELAELRAVAWRALHECCTSEECLQVRREACTRTLACEHNCGGCAGESSCPPCLQEGCRKEGMPKDDEWCAICAVDELHERPYVRLPCGHFVHFECAKQKLSKGYPGPAISFRYMECPVCPQVMDHPLLETAMKQPRALLEEVRKRALRRVKADTRRVKADELQPGGRFDGRPADYALSVYTYYICHSCQKPYFGGERACGEAVQDMDGFDAKELMCGVCSAPGTACKRGHGADYIEYKCRHCCSTATFFCFGTSHFCNACHRNISRTQHQTCAGGRHCPLRIPAERHPKIGEEHCLGCALCRYADED